MKYKYKKEKIQWLNYFGGSTPSYDLETEINKKYETSHITKDLIYKASRTFIGEISQYPPAFSALKKDGERMYEKQGVEKNLLLKVEK